jgi:hypothetical protein
VLRAIRNTFLALMLAGPLIAAENAAQGSQTLEYADTAAQRVCQGQIQCPGLSCFFYGCCDWCAGQSADLFSFCVWPCWIGLEYCCY